MATIAVANETKSTSIRTTKDGRQICYKLQVIQQPERARACGSGAKSSADRRPVDPPPIVELRVFENDQETTFAYNANFFLHASIENARAIASGRGAPPATPSFPVLTGTPVAGMAYLDRPTPAGYFIFPDLSVRHEGKYRLSFALFENLSEVKDLDPDDPDVICDGNSFVSHRAEVKSAPFVVFSAKKFPGLSESTALSRMVAEQGCRVRIRRDVRMRRRENKSSKEWNEFDDKPDSYEEVQRAATPDMYNQQQPVPLESDRPRSVSNATNVELAPPRRPSMDNLGQPYPTTTSYQQMPPPQNPAYPQMEPYNANQNQYQNQYAQQHNGLMQPPHTQYSHPPQSLHNGYQNQNAVQMNQPYDYQNYQQSHYAQQSRQDSATDYGHNEYRRASASQQPVQQYSAPNQTISPYTPMDQYNRPQQMHQPIQPIQPMHTSAHTPSISGPTSMHMSNPHPLPALKTLQPPLKLDKHEPVSPMYQSPSNMMQSAPMSANSDAQSNYSMPPTPSHLPPMSTTSAKRTFSSTFDTRYQNERLTQGARPSISGSSGPGAPGSNYDEPDIEPPMDRAAMNYRRADGTRIQRRVPDVSV